MAVSERIWSVQRMGRRHVGLCLYLYLSSGNYSYPDNLYLDCVLRCDLINRGCGLYFLSLIRLVNTGPSNCADNIDFHVRLNFVLIN